jgi:hypothetical protein
MAVECGSELSYFVNKIASEAIDEKLLWAEKSASKSKASKKGDLLDKMIEQEEYMQFSWAELEHEADDCSLSILWMEEDLAYEMGIDEVNEHISDDAAGEFKIANFEKFLDSLADLIELEKLQLV